MGTIFAENQQVVCNSGFDYGNYYGLILLLDDILNPDGYHER